MKTERKAIKNYTTAVSVERTISEIEQLLARYGARRVLKDYDDNGISALSFMVQFKGKFIPIRLPANIEKVILMLNDQVKKGSIPRKFRDNKDQARRIMWRVLLDWVDSQMTMVEIGQKELLEIFLSDVCDINNNQTLFQKMNNSGFSGYLLEAPKE
jgi:hypothetical protein